MKSKFFIAASLLVALSPLATPSAQALTREEVKAELSELRALGYHHEAEDVHYPEKVQDAMRRLHQKRMAKGADSSKVAGGAEAAPDTVKPSQDRQESQCTGPVSFCNPHFGS